MNLETLLKTIEDMAEQAGIPLNEYKLKIERGNGNYWIEIVRKDLTPEYHIKALSEIFNDVATNWYMKVHESHIHLIVE